MLYDVYLTELLKLLAPKATFFFLLLYLFFITELVLGPVGFQQRSEIIVVLLSMLALSPYHALTFYVFGWCFLKLDFVLFLVGLCNYASI